MSDFDHDYRMLGDAPEESELGRWASDGERIQYSNITSWIDPSQTYVL